MKLVLFLVLYCLALQNGKGAPRTAVYKFLRCNPNGDQANCVTQRSPEMAWSEDLPGKLPASAAEYLEAEPVEDEHPPREEKEEDESPMRVLPEEGSGGYEGSASESPVMGDWAFLTSEIEAGSGESWSENDMDLHKGVNMRGSRRLAGESGPAEQELREDHLLQL